MSVTYRQNDNYTDIYDGKIANSCQKIRGNKTKQRPKQQQNKTKQKQNKANKTNKQNKTKREEAAGVIKQVINRMV